MAKKSTAAEAKYIQKEIILAADALNHLFPTAPVDFKQPLSKRGLRIMARLFSDKDAPDQKAKRAEYIKRIITKIYYPSFEFDNLTSDFYPEENMISLEDKGITNYRIGYRAGAWLYYVVNRTIRDYWLDAIERLVCRQTPQDEPVQEDPRRELAHENLCSLVSHYCGLTYNQKGRFPNEDLSGIMKLLEQAKPDTLDHNFWTYQLQRQAIGMRIANILFERYSENEFKPLPVLGFDDARHRLCTQTGIDLVMP